MWHRDSWRIDTKLWRNIGIGILFATVMLAYVILIEHFMYSKTNFNGKFVENVTLFRII